MKTRKPNNDNIPSSTSWFSCVTRLIITIYASIILLIISGIIYAEEVKIIHPQTIIRAVRINPETPKIDGILDDEVWHKAPASADLIQKEPKEGQPPTEKTTIQIVYDDEALYVGVMCYDSEPDRIIARLTRRDGWVEADSVNLILDPYHDHQTGNWFLVNAAGMKNDGQIFDNGRDDGSWDGVWEAKTAIHDAGWSVEYRIPYHALRFNPKDEYVWGMHLGRHISRKNEDDHWSLIRKGINGLISQFGHIEGIRGINPPTHLEVVPFVVGRSTHKPENPDTDGRDMFSSMGLDLRYGLSSSVSLNATINPDFGQVEADPAGLNLTAFETFYGERRPFFVEGNTIFSTPGSGLLYTRRIGKQPGRFPIPEGSKLIDKPASTTILSAAKLSGKTESKTAFSIMDAVTAREYATIERTYADPVTSLEQIKREKHLIEPLTNYFAGRVKQDVMKNSNVGAMLTAVNREDDIPAYAAEVDGNLKWKDGKYSFSTRLAGSRTGQDRDRKYGYEAVASFGRGTERFGSGFDVCFRSPGFDINDLGFVSQTDRISAGGFICKGIKRPDKIVRDVYLHLGGGANWNYDGISLSKGGVFFHGITFKNNWGYGIAIFRDFKALDDAETRGGPLLLRPGKLWYWSESGTDGGKPISFGLNTSGGRTDDGASKDIGFGATLNIRPTSNMQFSVGPSYHVGYNFAQWVRNTEDSEGKHYVFGELKNQVLDLSTRVNVSFTPDLSFQLYLQPFVAVGDYSNFKELARPKSYDFIPYYRLDFNPDFLTRSLRSNAVLRWEYSPGSVLFLVWSQSRSASLEADSPSLDPYDDLKDSINDKGENVFLIKINYWLGL